MKAISLLFLCCLLTGCYQQKNDCTAFKTGTFTAEIIINDKKITSTFERTDSLQVEFYQNTIDSATVRWINDCEVIFHTINPKSRIDKKDIHLKILTTTDSSYTFEYSYVGDTKKQKGTAKKMP